MVKKRKELKKESIIRNIDLALKLLGDVLKTLNDDWADLKKLLEPEKSPQKGSSGKRVPG